MRTRITINVVPRDVEEFAISKTKMAERPLCDRCLTLYSRKVKLKGNIREFGPVFLDTPASAILD